MLFKNDVLNVSMLLFLNVKITMGNVIRQLGLFGVAGVLVAVPGKLDITAMNEACKCLVGEHDFTSFATALESRTKSKVRRVKQADVTKEGDLVTFRIVANSFLPHQVRNTIGALIKVGI